MRFDPVAARRWPDEQILAQCRWDAFRGPGPGGQKRNKTSSAVRVTHVPTGLCATAAESRSQAANRRSALRRLRMSMVLEMRDIVDLGVFTIPPWLEAHRHGGRLRIPARHDDFLPTAGLVLDVLAAAKWRVSDAARALGISSANLAAFLQADERLWAKVDQMRRANGLRGLICG